MRLHHFSLYVWRVWSGREQRDSGPPEELGLPSLGLESRALSRSDNLRVAFSLSWSLFWPFCFPRCILEILLWHMTSSLNPRESWFDWRGCLSSHFWRRTLAQSYLMDHHQPLWDIPAVDAHCGPVSGHLCSNHSSPLLFGAAGCGWEAYIRMGIWICLQRSELGPMSESCRKRGSTSYRVPWNGKGHKQIGGWIQCPSRPPPICESMCFLSLLPLFYFFPEGSNENHLFALLLKWAMKKILPPYN